jgi:gamma-glutamyltranspeptidase/glutathione hydrolase
MRSFGFLGPLAAMLLLSGCSLGHVFGLGSSHPLARAGGLAVSDEPLAANVGASVLAAGGNAADAATAMYFALAVTYPVAAGLGGGGLCIVHDPKSGADEQIDFPARESQKGGAYAVPGNVRGFAQLQGYYGVLPWARDIAPAESLAGGGFVISRALDARLTAAQNVIRLDADLSAEFMDESGHVKPAGATVSNPPLAHTLSAIRMGGEKAFYDGAIAAQLIAYSADEGGGIDAADLHAYAVRRGAARAMQIADMRVYLPGERTGAGAFSAALFEALRAQGAGVAMSGQAVSAAAKEALKHFGVQNLPQDMGATGFAAVDANGQAVGCAVTMNGPFGSGHSATGSGVVLARAPAGTQAGLASAFLTPVIATDAHGAVLLAGAGAGGPNGTAAIGYALMRLAAGAPLSEPSELRATGAAPYDTVNVITCSGGACFALPDPGAYGLGAAAVKF